MASLEDKKAIVIDDDKNLVAVFMEYLDSINIPVAGFGYNGKEAVKLFVAHKPDIVFLDLMMPEYDGIYGLENIRKIDPEAKVVIITSIETPELNESLNKLNPSAILKKPFDINSLRNIIEYLILAERQGIENKISNHKKNDF